MRAILLAAACVLVPVAARAQPAAQMVGLFVQGCIEFAGNPPDLRAWAKKNGLQEAPPAVSQAFLHNATGVVFDGSAPDVKLALISADSGLCSVATDQVTGSAVTAALEAGFQQAGVRFRLVIERDDKSDPKIHDREYLAAKDGRAWRVLEAVVKGDAGGEAMLTSGPE